MDKPVSNVDTGKTWRGLYTVSGAAAVLAGIFLVIGGLYLIATPLQPSVVNSWLSLVGNNWLVKFFQLHARINGVQLSQVYTLNLLDLGILVLVAVTFLGLYAAVRTDSRLWSVIALIQPFLGIVSYIATLVGRIAVVTAVLTMSLIMLVRHTRFSKAIAYVGVPAGVLLIIGDVSTRHVFSPAIAVLVGIGYILLVIWLFLVGWRLVQLRKHTAGRDTNDANRVSNDTRVDYPRTA